jgi:hypothetical protein
MGWIKRNLFFVIGGIITLTLLGVAGFYIYKGWSANSDASSKLNELYSTFSQINQEPMQPGNEKIDNMQTAKEQQEQMQTWIGQAENYFQPMAPIPPGAVTSQTFASALNNTVNQLRDEAKAANVNCPPDYKFSFQAQSTKLAISSGLGPLAEQLGQVKAISELLFASGVNDLLSIQRVRVSDDDASASASDYIDDRPITNNLAIITPYLITFQTFTPELAKVLVGFATSTNPFIAKLISVQPANPSGAPPDMGGTMPPPQPNAYNPHYPHQMTPPGYAPPGYAPPGYAPPGYAPPGSTPGYPQQAGATPMGRGGLQTVLKEQLLRITLQVEIVKLLPPKS